MCVIRITRFDYIQCCSYVNLFYEQLPKFRSQSPKDGNLDNSIKQGVFECFEGWIFLKIIVLHQTGWTRSMHGLNLSTW
jgi:hypothetical protein